MTHDASATGLTVRYGRTTAVNGIELTIPGGKVTAIVGPNGAGKSSVLLAMYGSVPSTGRVFVDGIDVSRMRPGQRARYGIALVPQGRLLFPRLTVRENLQVVAEMLRASPSVVDAAIDRFPILRQRMRSLAGVLSGGEQQMLVVSRALMAEPRVLLLDEMMTGLAPIIVGSLGDTIRQLAAEGVAILMAEPSIGALRRFIDRGYVLIRSQIAASDESGGPSLDSTYQRLIGVQQAEAETILEQLDIDGR